MKIIWKNLKEMHNRYDGGWIINDDWNYFDDFDFYCDFLSYLRV